MSFETLKPYNAYSSGGYTLFASSNADSYTCSWSRSGTTLALTTPFDMTSMFAVGARIVVHNSNVSSQSVLIATINATTITAIVGNTGGTSGVDAVFIPGISVLSWTSPVSPAPPVLTLSPANTYADIYLKSLYGTLVLSSGVTGFVLKVYWPLVQAANLPAQNGECNTPLFIFRDQSTFSPPIYPLEATLTVSNDGTYGIYTFGNLVGNSNYQFRIEF